MTQQGRAVQDCWEALPNHFENVQLDIFTVMPNHLHGIIIINSSERARHAVPLQRNMTPPPSRQSPANITPATPPPLQRDMTPPPSRQSPANITPATPPPRQRDMMPPPSRQFGKPVSDELPTIIRSFKSAVTKRIHELHNASVGARHAVPFHSDTAAGMKNRHAVPSVWQRNYYEHVIRNEDSLNRIREYIANNPLQWEFDRENPLAAPFLQLKTGSIRAKDSSAPKDEPWRV